MKETAVPDNDLPMCNLVPNTEAQLNPESSCYFAPPTYVQQLAEVPPSQYECYECYRSCCGYFLCCLGTACCCMCTPYVNVPQGYAGIQKRFGKAYRVVDPGVYFVNSMCEKMEFMDIRMQITDVPRQILTTKDNVAINIDSVVYWRVVDPFVAKFHVTNVGTALMQRALATLRDSVGFHTLQEVIENRQEIARSIKEIIDPTAVSWGIEIESILINDLRLTSELQENLSSVVKQQRLGQSKVIAAKAEVDAAKLFRQASDILNTPAAMRIRELDTMIAMAKTRGSKIVFTPEDLKKFQI
eukprot:TRINITY_DN2830_c0_g1_i19.p1 TRINITY_DN2830_c0_g1~~TRINITY_DN2830_c0_g1_i19.p1  ORF type:complete len:300 (-),score=60.96 TRINITY_DN2830_c0_g1_i19:118-1017(-)